MSFSLYLILIVTVIKITKLAFSKEEFDLGSTNSTYACKCVKIIKNTCIIGR